MLVGLANRTIILGTLINRHIQRAVICSHILHITIITHGKYLIVHLDKLDHGENMGDK